ncbi:hypothetical protein C0J52_06990 [Blattella germanica]|nr:hypothetical protein C0J52_06990 [Blattella germanica]
MLHGLLQVKMVVYESAGNNRFQHLLTNDWKPLCHYANTKQFFYNIFHKYCGFPESCPITKNQYKCQNANLDPNEAPKDLLKMGKGKEWKVTMELKLKKEIIAVWTFKVDIY